MKKYILFLFIIIFYSNSNAQQKGLVYAEFADMNFEPKITFNSDNTLKVVTGHRILDNLLSQTVIYEFRRCSSSRGTILYKTFSIVSNNLPLMLSLKNLFPQIIIESEGYNLPENQSLYIPNDFSLMQALDPGWEQKYLNRIDAQGAWDRTKGSPEILIGIADYGYYLKHEELTGKNIVQVGNIPPYITGGAHGTFVTGLAAGDTDNGVGLSSIGFNSGIALISGMSVASLSSLVDNGAKVVNASWYSGLSNTGGVLVPNEQSIIDAIIAQDAVVVVAAGNGPLSGSAPTTLSAESYASRYYYPASYRNVISVSTVGNWNEIGSTSTPFENWINVHKIKTPSNTFYNGTNIPVSEAQIFHQHNDSVDIVVPAYRVPEIGVWAPNAYFDSWIDGISGTSFSAPIVAGTVALMFDVNYCLKPKEIESILKLTTDNIEQLPENEAYVGRLGAGSLNAGKAVEMAYQMALPFGVVNITDRNLYRWFYKLHTAPYEIKLSNNKVFSKAKLKLFARNSIDITSGDYSPNDEGYITLEIDENITSICNVSKSKGIKKSSYVTKDRIQTFAILFPNPNSGQFEIKVNHENVNEFYFSIFDLSGREVYNAYSEGRTAKVDLPSIVSGVYQIRLTAKNYSETIRFIKN